jgi:hypothetical protein
MKIHLPSMISQPRSGHLAQLGGISILPVCITAAVPKMKNGPFLGSARTDCLRNDAPHTPNTERKARKVIRRNGDTLYNGATRPGGAIAQGYLETRSQDLNAIKGADQFER